MRGCVKRVIGIGVLAAALPLSAAQQAAEEEKQAMRTPLASEAGQTLQIEQEETAVVRQWQLRRGLPVHSQLLAWAEQSGWTLSWKPRVSWLVAADVQYQGSFEQALQEVIEGLFFEGKPVRLVMWQGNRLAEVLPSDTL